jgi:hypothetical protein
VCFFGSNADLASVGPLAPSFAERGPCVALLGTASPSLPRLCARLRAPRSPSCVFHKSRFVFLVALFDFANSAADSSRKGRKASPAAHTSRKKVETHWSGGRVTALGGAAQDSFCSWGRSSLPECSVEAAAGADPTTSHAVESGLGSGFGRDPAAVDSSRGFGRECSLAAAVGAAVATVLSAAFAAEVSAHEQVSPARPLALA